MISISNFIQSEKKLFKNSVCAFLPETVIIPFKQAYKSHCTAMVSPGDIVTEGQIVAQCRTDSDDMLPENIHASVPGKVIDICLTQLPDGTESLAAKIHLEGRFSYRGKKHTDFNWETASCNTLAEIIAARGIVNTFDSNKPVFLSEDVSHCRKRHSSLLIVRLFDEDPSSATDSTLARLYIKQIFTGAAILARTITASGLVCIYNACDSLIPATCNSLTELLHGIPVSYVAANCRKYPCGFKRDIFTAIGRSSAAEPFSQISMSDLYTDASTMLQLYNAVVFSIPVIDQYVHVKGNCLPASGILKTCIGTSLGALAEQCGGFTSEPSKIIINGLFTGCAISSLDIPVTKNVKSVTFIPAGLKFIPHQTTCIRCGKCRNICPAGLCPDVLYMYIAHKVKVDEIYLKTAALCSGCSLCNAVCSARLPLSQTIALLKDDIHE